MLRLLVRSALVAASLIAAGSAGGSISATKQAAPPARLWLGFQDDATFRWGTERQAMLDRAARAGTTIIRSNVYWWQIAPERPTVARDPFDAGYHFDDLDQLVRDSQARGISLLLTIWGTPPWANGGKGKNVAPTRAADLTNFAYALASRYSGRFPGFPYVGFYSIWNEPNLQQFLAPQFDASGKPVAPRAYATLYKAGYAGIKSGNSTAKVAIGETSPRGHDKPTTVVQPSESPGGFAQQLSKFKGLKFDAWAHHPYPTQPGLPPTQQGTWPNVTLAQLPRFELSLDKWFKRKNIPIWATEYGYQSKPPGTLGVSLAKQALYLRAGSHEARERPARADDHLVHVPRLARQSRGRAACSPSPGRRSPRSRRSPRTRPRSRPGTTPWRSAASSPSRRSGCRLSRSPTSQVPARSWASRGACTARTA